MRRLWLIFGWSALLIILDRAYGDEQTNQGDKSRRIAHRYQDFLLTAREILEEVDPDPKE